MRPAGPVAPVQDAETALTWPTTLCQSRASRGYAVDGAGRGCQRKPASPGRREKLPGGLVPIVEQRLSARAVNPRPCSATWGLLRAGGCFIRSFHQERLSANWQYLPWRAAPPFLSRPRQRARPGS